MQFGHREYPRAFCEAVVARLLKTSSGRSTLALSLNWEQAREYVSRMGLHLEEAFSLRDGVPCRHPGCPHHVTHPCDGCGRVGGRRTRHLFLDCDGVLANFEEAATRIFGKPPREAEAEIGSNKFWRTLKRQPNFYGTLPLMPDAMVLYNAVKHLNPTILTGCPLHGWAEPQKIEWAARCFPGVPITTCPAKDKREYMTGPGDILVDDQLKYAPLWREYGGVFVHHTNAENTLLHLHAIYELPSFQELAEVIAQTDIQALDRLNA